MSIGERITEERKRIGNSQDEWAALTGIHRNTQIKYERGDVVPDANYLAAVDSVGADISYIVTGDKGVTVSYAEALARECAIIFNVVESLEAALIEVGKNLPPHKKALAVSMLFRSSYPHGVIDKQMVGDVIALA